MKVQSMRKSKEQELEAAGHIVSTVSPREQRTLASTALLLFTETTQEPWEWFYPREMDLLPLITPSRRCPTGMPSAHLPGRSRFCQAVDEHWTVQWHFRCVSVPPLIRLSERSRPPRSPGMTASQHEQKAIVWSLWGWTWSCQKRIASWFFP